MKSTFGASVKLRRNQLGFSQERLAERSDLHRTYISDVEHGRRNISIETMEKLAAALDISVVELFLGPGISNGKFPDASNDGGTLSFALEILLVSGSQSEAKKLAGAFAAARISNPIFVVDNVPGALAYVFRQGSYARRQPGKPPDLVLLDTNFPETDLVDFLRGIKSDKKTAPIPVALLVKSAHDRILKKCKNSGVETHVVKPIGFQSLRRLVEQLNLNWQLFKDTESTWE